MGDWHRTVCRAFPIAKNANSELKTEIQFIHENGMLNDI
jgi:hypothetical protein